MPQTRENLNKIENALGWKLKRVALKDVTQNRRSYAVNENQDIIGLNLHDFNIKDLSFLKHVPNLMLLDVKNNQICDLSFLKHVPNLTQLDVSSNQISDISVLKYLKHLGNIDLTNNKISDLPKEIAELSCELGLFDLPIFGLLNLSGNPIKTPPLEIVDKGKDAVLAYFKSLEGERQELNEVKVLLVGDGGSGKTSMVKRLLDNEFDENEQQTHGINIRTWEVTVKNKPIKVHTWDFGGQEIMHATHQFFLSKRSLYILVLDGRKEEDAEYWLKLIESFGSDSPILVVLNKIDQNPGFDVNRRFLKEKYNGIYDFYPVSCAKGNGFAKLSGALKSAMTKVEMLETTWPKSWFNIKTHLETMNENFISYSEFNELCIKENIAEKDAAETLVDFLNDLGIVVHFKDFRLLDTHVLNPRWVTEAVYKIINSEIVAYYEGIVRLGTLERILKKKSENDYFYPSDKHRYIIDLMLKFELCYELENQTILIPDLLEVQEPEINFNYNNSLKFIIEYQ